MGSGLPQAKRIRERIQIRVERSGDWMPADELKAMALDALEAGKDVTISLDHIDHLNASALQILLALDAEEKNRRRCLELAHVSPHLRQWFDYAGASDQFSMIDEKNDG
jgi:anti-anti-sigma regulatory factor